MFYGSFEWKLKYLLQVVYKHFGTGTNEEAEDTCFAQGGHMAAPRNPKENQDVSHHN